MKTPILFINTDQLRPDFLGCYGFPVDSSPHIDTLARDGVLMRNTYTQCPICVPARYSLTSGQYVCNHGAYTNNHAPFPTTRSLVPAFEKAGYHTVAIGKLHHNPVDSSFGFDEVFLHDGTFRDRRPYSIYSKFLQENGKDEDDLAYAADVDETPEKRRLKDRTHWGRCRFEDRFTESTFLGDFACNYISEYDRDETPFLYLSFVAPHSPYCPPVPYDTMFNPDDMPTPPRESEDQWTRVNSALAGLTKNEWGELGIPDATMREIRAQYAGLLRHMDEAIGRSIDAFRAKFGEDALIVLTSDHGDFLGEHHRCEKHFMYEAAVRIPYIVCWPGHIAPGQTVDGLARQIDMFPTVLGLVGASVPGAAGKNTAQALLDGNMQGYEYVFAENHDVPCFSWTAMARSQSGKLVVHLTRDHNAVPTYAYYDLESDPYELDNRIDDPVYAEAIQAHREAFDTWMVETHRNIPACR